MSRLPRRIKGYAIVSREGMISLADGTFPPGLKLEADQRFFHDSVARAVGVANGRHSAEDDLRAAERPRLVLTRRIAALEPHPANPHALLWNPAGASLDQAWDALGVDGTLAVVGGTDVFGLFLAIGYDDFFLSRAPVSVPDGRPVFPGVPTQIPEALLAAHGLVQRSERVLDERAQVTLAQWSRA
jgi:dihydrofolate reductase